MLFLFIPVPHVGHPSPASDGDVVTTVFLHPHGGVCTVGEGENMEQKCNYESNMRIGVKNKSIERRIAKRTDLYLGVQYISLILVIVCIYKLLDISWDLDTE